MGFFEFHTILNCRTYTWENCEHIECIRKVTNFQCENMKISLSAKKEIRELLVLVENRCAWGNIGDVNRFITLL